MGSMQWLLCYPLVVAFVKSSYVLLRFNNNMMLLFIFLFFFFLSAFLSQPPKLCSGPTQTSGAKHGRVLPRMERRACLSFHSGGRRARGSELREWCHGVMSAMAQLRASIATTPMEGRWSGWFSALSHCKRG